jgi:hypothetical protein
MPTACENASGGVTRSSKTGKNRKLSTGDLREGTSRTALGSKDAPLLRRLANHENGRLRILQSALQYRPRLLESRDKT